jgi:hypothetical protein
MENKGKDSYPEWPDDDVIYVPDEIYYGIHRALCKMEQAQAELRKMRDGTNAKESEK